MRFPLLVSCIVHAVLLLCSLSSLNLMKISTYNCQSSNRNIGSIQLLCNSSDIVFLQEHWLFPSDLPNLNLIHPEFMAYGISSMNMHDGIVMPI